MLWYLTVRNSEFIKVKGYFLFKKWLQSLQRILVETIICVDNRFKVVKLTDAFYDRCEIRVLNAAIVEKDPIYRLIKQSAGN
jgi:hypothetical protein